MHLEQMMHAGGLMTHIDNFVVMAVCEVQLLQLLGIGDGKSTCKFGT